MSCRAVRTVAGLVTVGAGSGSEGRGSSRVLLITATRTSRPLDWTRAGLDWTRAGLDWISTGLDWTSAGLDWTSAGLDWTSCPLGWSSSLRSAGPESSGLVVLLGPVVWWGLFWSRVHVFQASLSE